MKIAIIAIVLACTSAAAKAPPVEASLSCDGSTLIVDLQVRETGIYRLTIDRDICSKSVSLKPSLGI